MVFGLRKNKKAEKEGLRQPVNYSKRYDRQKALQEMGEAGQEKLKKARVLIVGCGDLGTAAAMYLAAAGVGTIGLADNKEIEVTDIQRQPIYFNSDIGKKKVYVLADRLKEINPDVNAVPNKIRMRHDNTMNVVNKYDVVIDCTDNYPSHYLLNDACVLSSKPLVFATSMKFDGQASIFYAQKGPCYRCLYREPPHPGTVKETKDVGVLGPAAGLAGLIEAAEAIKLITGIGNPLVGRMLFFSAFDMHFNETKVIKNDNCEICGKNPKITQLIDYEEYCGVKARPEPASSILDKAKKESQHAASTATLGVPLLQQKIEPEITEISPKDVKKKLDAGEKFLIIDVREPHERELANIDGTIFIPLGELHDKMAGMDKNEFIVAHCHHGVRSAFAVEMLRNAGFAHAYSIAGGIDEWSNQVDSNVPKYS